MTRIRTVPVSDYHKHCANVRNIPYYVFLFCLDCHEERRGPRLGAGRVLRRHGGGGDPGPHTRPSHRRPANQGAVLHPRGQRHQHLHERGERAREQQEGADG